MADAWELLQEHSTLPEIGFDAWEHLNAQEGGGVGPCEGIVLLDGLEVIMEDACVDVELDLGSVDVEIQSSEYEVEIDTPEYEVEVC